MRTTSSPTDDYWTETLADGVRFVLPQRKFHRTPGLAWALVVTGFLATIFMFAWMGFPIGMGVKLLVDGQTFGWAAIGFGLLGLLGLSSALRILLVGLSVVRNRSQCVVEVRKGKLFSNESLLLFTWRRSRDVQRIQRLSVERITGSRASKSDDAQGVLESLGDLGHGIVAAGDDKKKFFVAPVYPAQLLERLARDLAPYVEAETELSESVEVTGPSGNDGDAAVPPQPVGSEVTVDRRPDGITLSVPPVGVWMGSKGLLLFSLIWNAMITIFAVLIILAAMGIIDDGDGDPPTWVALFFLLPFIAVGVGMFLGAINMGRRRAVIATKGETLFVQRESIFRTTQKEWRSEDLDEIRCGESAMEANEVSVNELQLIPRKGKKFGMLSQLDDDEIAWMAAELRRALGLSRSGDDGVERDASGRPILPRDSRVRVQELDRVVSVEVPPARGFGKFLAMITVGLVCMGIGLFVTIGVLSSDLKDDFAAGETSGIVFMLIWCTCFVGGGFSFVLAGLVFARRQFHIEISPTELTLHRQGPFGRRTFRWLTDDLEDVRVADSGGRAGAKKYYELRIKPRRGAVVKIMTGHDRQDLEYVAAVVRETAERSSGRVDAVAQSGSGRPTRDGSAIPQHS